MKMSYVLFLLLCVGVLFLCDDGLAATAKRPKVTKKRKKQSVPSEEQIQDAVRRADLGEYNSVMEMAEKDPESVQYMEAKRFDPDEPDPSVHKVDFESDDMWNTWSKVVGRKFGLTWANMSVRSSCIRTLFVRVPSHH